MNQPKRRADVMKQHYWLQLDLEIRAETLESAIKRAAGLFRKAYRDKLGRLDSQGGGLVYMGAHSARCRGSLRAPRTMHTTVQVKKGLPLKPGTSLAEIDAEDDARRARKEKRIGCVALDTPSEPHVIPGVPKPTVVTGPVVKKKASMAGLFGR